MRYASSGYVYLLSDCIPVMMFSCFCFQIIFIWYYQETASRRADVVMWFSIKASLESKINCLYTKNMALFAIFLILYVNLENKKQKLKPKNF